MKPIVWRVALYVAFGVTGTRPVLALDQVVGFSAQGAMLVRDLPVLPGAMIAGARFGSNRLGTEFGPVLLLDGSARTIIGSKVLARVDKARPDADGIVRVQFQPAVAVSTARHTIVVAVGVPPDPGPRRPGIGAGIAGTQTMIPCASFVAAALDEPFQALDVELAIELVYAGPVGKTDSERSVAYPRTLSLSVGPILLGSGEITVAIGKPGFVRIDVLDVRGRRIRRLFSGPLTAGIHPQEWNGHDDKGFSVSTGLYVILAMARDENVVVTRKVVLLR